MFNDPCYAWEIFNLYMTLSRFSVFVRFGSVVKFDVYVQIQGLILWIATNYMKKVSYLSVSHAHTE